MPHDPFKLEAKKVECEVLHPAPITTEPTPYHRQATKAVRWGQRNALAISAVAVGIPIAVANFPFLQEQIRDIGAARQQNASAAKAEQRYRSGCRAVTWANELGVAGSLTPGQPVNARSDAKGNALAYVPPGVTVCDVYGGTGVIQPGNPPVLGDYASTGNLKVVEESPDIKKLINRKVQVKPMGVK
jgi:hypothetical protein